MNNNRFTDRMIGTVAPNLCLPSLDGPSLDGPSLHGPSLHGRVCLSDFAGRRHVVLYFMPRFTSSAAWRGAVALGRLQNALQKENTIVLLIGRGGYLRPATKLAAELDLPFTVLADEEWEAACRYGLDEEALPHPAVATFLVDEWGIVRHADIGAHPGALFDAPRLMREVRCLRTRAPLTKPVPWLYEPVELASCGR